MFFMVVRIYIDSQRHNSVEYFVVSDYTSVDACILAAEARFHNIITADLQNKNVNYQQTYIIDDSGKFVENPVIFDRRIME